MSSRTLLSITLGDASLLTIPSVPFSSWDVCAVDDLPGARKAMGQHPYPVGLLLVNNVDDSDVGDVETLLEAHQSTQWVGVFRTEKIKQPMYRALIIEHLFDFHTWPIDPFRLNHTLGHAYGFAELFGPPDVAMTRKRDMTLVGQSTAIQHLRKQIAKVAQADAPVLIWGERGSGKELVARAIHNQSPRTGGPFIAVNCGAMATSMIHSELFGHERGIGTGAASEKRGLIESAANGTLFLDEIGELPLEVQATLLRFLQVETLNRVGSAQPVGVNVRVIAASHMRLQDAVRSGGFREDLLYRLNVLPLTVPALRERKEDLELLVRHFSKVFARDKSPRFRGFSKQALLALQAHDWPGNVRELVNCVRKAMVMSEGRLITPQDMDLPASGGLRNGEALEEARIRAERHAIHVSLQDSGSNITRAARGLGVSRMTLYRLMEKHGISS